MRTRKEKNMGKSSSSRSRVRDEDFQEEDVWFYAAEMERKTKDISRGSSSSSSGTKMVRQSSAPVKIPNWSEIYGKEATLGSSWVYDEEEYVGEIVPPHEWMARKVSTRQIPSFSVCEGVGRTLKGRDLCQLRHVVLTKTGFLE